ncbi:GTPase IMAP family member 8-like isoform X2 [Triplophysa dalaica]|uniref:GTPase IMAP family member 8-like isoform X2 n=1 Tax=Triplophysa dalaica TaxID=1582913 RepID=UPI0024DF9AFD|nr:GTPase IMAP family member 8-like isoform X2 [Triplophysa dalaica]
MSEDRTKQDSTSGSKTRLSEIRMLMIGGRELGGKEASGKSSAGNIILGRNAFDTSRRTARSVQSTGNIHGRHLTVVDTPGWWWHYTIENTPLFDRHEIMKSPTLCPPGPHVVLLVIPVDLAFPSIHTMAVEEHLKFLSKKVWRHIIVLFTSVEPYDESSLKNNFRKWPDLEQLLKRCHNRYHILNINNKSDNTQVITLLEKIEKMVAQNNDKCLEISQSISALVKKEKATKARDKQRTVSEGKQMPELQADNRDGPQHLTDIRTVIVGASWAARSSAGNVILGEEVFEVDESRTTVRCAVGHAEVHGRKITVVDTPGWYYNSPLENTSEMDKLEIRHSVYLCPSGPHAILVTVPIATAFNKAYQTAVEENMSLLGENVWNHTIVLFTRGDWLGDSTIEERIETEEGRLEWLMEKCGYRYHVLNCKQYSDGAQVVELLEKIEKMVTENNGCYYVPDIKSDPADELEKKKKTATTNKINVSKQRHILKELLKDVRIVLLGAEGVGKSTAGNIILHGYFFESTLAEGHEIHTRQCVTKQCKVEGINVSVVDTPGWSKSTVENEKEISRSLAFCSPGPHAFLLVLPVHMPFTMKSQQTVEELMSLFGENVWSHTIILFTEGHWLKDKPVEEYIACEGEALQKLVSKCGNRYHVMENDWSNRAQVRDLLKMIQQMVARNRGEHFTLEQKGSKLGVLRWLRVSKTMTEEEWMEREDKLIDRVLKTLVVDPDENPKQSSHRLKGSFEGSIPNMSGDSGFSDFNSECRVDVFNSTFKVSNWLGHPENNPTSSGYDTMSIVSSTQYQKMEDVKVDSYMPRHPEDTPKPVSDTSAQKHSRSISI